MADYKDYYDFMNDQVAKAAAEPVRRVQKKVIKTYTFDFGAGPYTVEDFQEWAKELVDIPPGAKVHINAGDSQRDGSWLKITVQEG
jgi:hypothetical protein